MKRLLIFLVLVGLAVPGWGDSTWIDRFQFGGVESVGDTIRGKSKILDTLRISDPLLVFDSIVVVGPYRDRGAFSFGPPEKRGWFAITVDFYAKQPIRFNWFGNPFPIRWDHGGREIIGRGETVFRYKLLADTIICKGRCKEITLEDVMRWLETPHHRQLFIENLGKEED